MTVHKPMVIAHRGAKGMAPENTMAAFRLGLEQGCEGIELDVHLSSDGEVIVCHDETLDRTTSGSGLICEKTLSEIKSVDAGAWYSAAYAGERVPTLDEVLDLVPESVMINVEVKHSYGGQMEQRLIELLRKRGRIGQVVVSSFDHKCVRRIKKLEPQVKIGLLYTANLFDPAAYAQSFDVEVYSLHPYHGLLDAVDVEKAIKAGLRVYPYTANTEQELSDLIKKGVSGIITDYPGRLKDILTSL